jgi:hypothetical protein
MKRLFASSFPGSAWERAALEAPPLDLWQSAASRQSLAISAFPGRAWERAWWLALGLTICATITGGSRAWALDSTPDEFAGKGTWNAPAASAVQQQLNDWLDGRSADAAAREQVKSFWPDAAEPIEPEEQLDRVVASFAVVDERAANLIKLCSAPKQAPHLPDLAWLAEEGTPAFERNNLRLYLARWLVRNRLFDEGLAQLESLEPDQVVDPAGLLFYQAVVYQRMLKKQPGLASLGRLLEKPNDIPKRYASLAKLLQADLEQLEDDSLDHIARRMDDVERRLDLGRAGPKTREVEDGVIKSLDKLIKELEDQAAAAAAAAAAQGTIRSASPAQDSRPMGGKGPGQVAKKDIGDQSGWGNLPPKQRQEALQQIGKDFPAHYRDMIEQYFRKLASEEKQP